MRFAWVTVKMVTGMHTCLHTEFTELLFIFNKNQNMLTNVLIYTQQDATLHSLFYLETALYVSVGTTTHHQECKQLYLQHVVFVTLLLLPAAGSSDKYQML